MTRFLPPLALLTGCVILSGDAHDERITALTEQPTPTDPVTPPPTDTADTDDTDDTDVPVQHNPVLTSAAVRFRYNDFGFFRGLQLLIQVTDEDGDLAGGEVQIQGGETIPWSMAIPLVDDQYLVPIHLDMGEACHQPDPVDLTVFVRDLQGNASDTRQATAKWDYRDHDESNIQSADECEPCSGQVLPVDLPVIACGSLGTNHGYVDFLDYIDVLLAPASPRVTAVANLDNVVGLVGFSYGDETHTWSSQQTNDGSVGLTLHSDPVTAPAAHSFWVYGVESTFASAEWQFFIDRKLPDPLP